MKTILTTLILFSATVAIAQEVKNFTLVNVRDGKEVALTNYTSSKAIVVIFISNQCPFDSYYKDRIKELIQSYAGKVQFLLINANTEDQENNVQMSMHYTDLAAPYLADKEQLVMNQLMAKRTPETFLIIPSGGKFLLAYNGAIDDNPQAAQDVQQSYLKDAIERVMANQKVTLPTQRVTGCTIRKK